MNELDDLGFVYIAEETSPDYTMRGLNVHDKGHVFFVEFDAVLHSFEVINRNNRQYLRSNLEDLINNSEKIQDWLAKNAWYGEMDHPAPNYENEKLTQQRIANPYMPNRSHKILKPTFRGNLLEAHIQTASGTEAGRGFANEIIQGLIPSFSCRMLATLKLINCKPTVIGRKLITYDWVLYPSHKEARMISRPNAVNKGIKTITESAKDFIKKKSKDIIIPLKEILEYVGMKDVNTQIIMESFDLDTSDIIGFDDNKNHLMIRDDQNVIYSKMSREIVNEVHDFYRSFNI